MTADHICKGDNVDPTHGCSCEIGHDHTAADHRYSMHRND